ncbi:hypothetical protein HAP94_18525 [Acidithiobacillus ferrivorans]|nr:hypothetical protein [Acidithiobacillus ferrivorans]
MRAPVALPIDASPKPEDATMPTTTTPQERTTRKAGRPRIHPDQPLSAREKAARYRQARKVVAQQVATGETRPTALSNKDLCLAVARMLGQPNDLELRQTGYPLIKELQRRMKGL